MPGPVSFSFGERRTRDCTCSSISTDALRKLLFATNTTLIVRRLLWLQSEVVSQWNVVVSNQSRTETKREEIAET